MRTTMFTSALLLIIVLFLLSGISSAQSGFKPPSPSCPSGNCTSPKPGTFYGTEPKALQNNPGSQQKDIKPVQNPNAGSTSQSNRPPASIPIPPVQDPSPTTRSKPPAPSPAGTNPAKKNLLISGEEIFDGTEPGSVYNNTINILPELTTKINMSSTEINRVVCPVEIKDVVYSKEKGLNVKIQNKNAFLKFTMLNEDGKKTYANLPTEVYIACGESIYSMVVYPKRIPPQTVKLSTGKGDAMKRNNGIFTGMPYERKIMAAIKAVFTDAIPDSFAISNVNRPINAFQQIDLVMKRIITIEGEGIKIKEYSAKAKTDVYLKEKDFMRSDLATKTSAISISSLKLKKDETARILIVEQGDNE